MTAGPFWQRSKTARLLFEPHSRAASVVDGWFQ
jgi:hypothetical protein